MNASVVAGAGERNRVVGLIAAGHFYSHFASLILPPLFPLLKPEFGVTYVALGSLIGVYAVALGAAQVPFGFLVDRFGGRPVLLSGIALLGAAFALMAFATDYWHLAALMVVAGVGNSVFHPADYAILSARIDEGFLGRAMSIHSFSGYAGWPAAPAAMLALSQMTDWRTAVLVAGLFGIGIAVLLASQGGSLGYAVARGARGDGASPWREGLRLMRSRPMLMMFAFFLLTSSATGGIMSFAVVAVMNLYGAAEATANSVLTAFLVGMAAGVIVGGLLADRTGRHNLVTSVSVAAMAALVALVALGAMPVLLALGAMAAGGFLFGIATPSRDLLVRAASSAGSVGVAFGFASTGMGIGAAVGPVVCGWLMDAGRPDRLFLTIAAVLAAAVIVVIATRPAAAPDPAVDAA